MPCAGQMPCRKTHRLLASSANTEQQTRQHVHEQSNNDIGHTENVLVLRLSKSTYAAWVDRTPYLSIFSATLSQMS